ncbi:hypothetical protein BV20DRAFT_824315 [Pilatotrama ljubarskyi]|nr:hypothetical protein BV20DRAFT_824315 [Pilatotrama ljubarskyi]
MGSRWGEAWLPSLQTMNEGGAGQTRVRWICGTRPLTAITMSLYEFTCHERHPSSPNTPYSSSPAPLRSSPVPAASANGVWDEDSQLVEPWDDSSQLVEPWDDGSQRLDDWPPSQEHSSPCRCSPPSPSVVEGRSVRHAALNSVRRTSR